MVTELSDVAFVRRAAAFCHSARALARGVTVGEIFDPNPFANASFTEHGVAERLWSSFWLCSGLVVGKLEAGPYFWELRDLCGAHNL